MSFNILIVDDSPVARRIVRKTISMSKLETGEVHEAGDGVEALEVLARKWVDVVFTDINMPRMDGDEMIRRMAADNLLTSIPVIVVSTDRSPSRMECLIQLGARAYLTKPLTPEAVCNVVHKVLGSPGGVA